MGEEIRTHPTIGVQAMIDRAIASLPPRKHGAVVTGCYDAEEKLITVTALAHLKDGWSVEISVEKPNNKGFSFGASSIWSW